MNEVTVNNAPSFKDRAKALAGKVAATSMLAMGTVGSALAQSEAEGIIETQKALALAVVVAGTVAILAIRYTKLARRA